MPRDCSQKSGTPLAASRIDKKRSSPARCIGLFRQLSDTGANSDPDICAGGRFLRPNQLVNQVISLSRWKFCETVVDHIIAPSVTFESKPLYRPDVANTPFGSSMSLYLPCCLPLICCQN